MTEPLSPRAARRLLRRQILRRSRLYLLPAVLLVAGSVAWTALGHFRTSSGLYDGAQLHDSFLRLCLFLVAFAIAIALVRSTEGSRKLWQRLPADSPAPLHARLQLAAGLGAVAFAALLATEFLARPATMHPSFPGRLNPTEADTLERLPGVPLLRFTVDGEVRRALASELSVAAIQPGPRGDIRIWSYGQTSRWPHHEGLPQPRPGDVLATLGAGDWPRLADHELRRLRRLGVPFGATVEIALERYVPEAEYRARPWRRDGLGRERRWHAFDRAVGFFGLLVFLVCALSSPQTSPALVFGAPLAVAVFQRSDLGLFDLRRVLLFTDLSGRRPRFPTLGLESTAAENLLFPLAVAAVCAAAYAAGVQQKRLSPDRHRPGTAAEALRGLWHTGTLRRVELVAVTAFFVLWTGSVVFELWGDAWVLRRTVWMFAVLGVTGAALTMSARWARRDALLSRLPVPPAAVARRRLARTAAVLAGIALLALAIEHALPVDPLSLRHGGLRLEGGAPWAKCLLVVASGSLIMVFALLQPSPLGSQLTAALCLPLAMMAMPLLNVRDVPWLNAASLGVVLVAPPLLHRLLRRRVELGRAPGRQEIFG